MKNISLLLMVFLFSQMTRSQENETYGTLWKETLKLENKGLTKSALKTAMSISEKAKKDKNPVQIAKALLFTSKYALILEENAQLKIITDFKSEIKKAQFPIKNVLESYLANLYWQYFQQNRYRFYNRSTTTTKVDPVDFRTWDLTTLFKEINIHFERSLNNETDLQRIPIARFDILLNRKAGSNEYRPTLFDILAHTALKFYKTSENSITRPADKFELNDPHLLSEAGEYIKSNIHTSDNTSLQARALAVYQKLLRFHISSSHPYALAAVDIERLLFIHANATFKNKDALYEKVLKNTLATIKEKPAASLYNHEIAALYAKQGNSYDPKTNKAPRWKLKEALELCNAIIKKYPKSKGAEKSRALKESILSKSLTITNEKHIPVNKPARLLVNYKNYGALLLRAFKASQKQVQKLEVLQEAKKKSAFIQTLPEVKAWEAGLTDKNDYLRHSTEIVLPALKNGTYILLAMPKDGSEKTFAYSTIQVTDFALVQTRARDHQKFQVVNRNNGKPYSGANIELTYQKGYNAPTQTKGFITDTMGFIALPDEYWNNVNIKITHKAQEAHFGKYYINKSHDPSPSQTDYTCFLFTDRSIYRPGQPLYFKGIALKTDKNGSSILENTLVNITLKDVNGQTIGTQESKTNGHGSFSGKFILPSNGLTGNFSLRIKSPQINKLHGHTGFSVEEYKRPKFETSFEPIAKSYKINDSITVIGNAKAFAGSNITNAKVSYRVRRAVNFPKWYYWNYPYNNYAPQEISYGETTTDATGRYSISFKAVPNYSIAKKSLPIFKYEVIADVTDVNGETHSTSTFVSVGYHALVAQITVPDLLDKDKKKARINISTKNLNGQFAPASGTLKIYKLLAPKTVLRPRVWPAPDYNGLTKEKSKELFPHDAHTNEHDPNTWKKGEVLWQTSFDTSKNTEAEIGNLKKWPSGKYIIELEAKDTFGQPVKAMARTTLFSDADKQLADNLLFKIKTDKQIYGVGDNVEVTLLSNVEGVTVSVFVEKNKKIVDTKLIYLNKNIKSFTIPVTKNDLGGFSVAYSYCAYNSYENGNLSISVPYPVKDLRIKTLVFRDKLLPGADETWSFKIKGPKGEKVSAELLASMYDASLNEFREHSWSFHPLAKPTYYPNYRSSAQHSFGIDRFRIYPNNDHIYDHKAQYFDSFAWFGLYFGNKPYYNTGTRTLKRSSSALAMAPQADMEHRQEEIAMESTVSTGAPSRASEQKKNTIYKNEEPKENDFKDVRIRKDLKETAFFFPHLQTDKEGNVSFAFTAPEALTKWNLQLLAHDKKLRSAISTLQAVTQKKLMVLPNTPRFLREGDIMTISTKIANLTDKNLYGQAKLELKDALSDKTISADVLLNTAQQSFKVDSLGNTQLSWRLKIPEGLQAVQYKVVAKTGEFSDGEQNLLPVLTNRTLVTETMPFWARSNQTKTFVFNKLKGNTSKTLKNHKLTLELTSNPAWYAVQALPYLMEYPYECNEQIFSRFYANSLAHHIANKNPRIKEVFDQWKNTDALLSNLEKNQELRSLLIQETPWLRDALSETQQKKRIALLFDLDKMKNEQNGAMAKLKKNQKSSGAWSWFNGGPNNRYITQHIVSGLGHLKKLGVSSNETEIGHMLKKAIQYLDNEFVGAYERIKKNALNINDDHLTSTQIHYLYMRSFFKNVKTPKKVDDATAYYKTQAQKYWSKRNLYSKGMLALILNRMDDTKTADQILRSLKENSITSEESGMYWKENTSSWHWYQAPIETQALMIEAFSEIGNNVKVMDDLKIWLLKNKRTNQWSTTKATAEAVYALLLQGSDWLPVADDVNVYVGSEKIEPSKLENVRIEAGTGYLKTAWSAKEIISDMGTVKIQKKGKGIAWGALYWQYFEDLDNIAPAETPLKSKKKLFLKKNTGNGEKITEIGPKTILKVGDLVRVRILLHVDRTMEFVHMKDMRAAGFEPVNVNSSYKWQDGLGYYESTKDASTNFFFDYLPKGVYVFEYDVRVNNAGDFSNGITTVQSMYAPEFSNHSKGIRVQVK